MMSGGAGEKEKGFGYVFNMHSREAAAEEASKNEIQQLLMFPFQQSRWPFLLDVIFIVQTQLAELSSN